MKYDKKGITVYDNTHKRGEGNLTIKHVLPGSQTKNHHSRKKNSFSRKVIYLFIYFDNICIFP